jgi:hypothetical protein
MIHLWSFKLPCPPRDHLHVTGKDLAIMLWLFVLSRDSRLQLIHPAAITL